MTQDTKSKEERCQDLRDALDGLLAMRGSPLAVQPDASLTEVPDPSRDVDVPADIEEQIRHIEEVMAREGCN